MMMMMTLAMAGHTQMFALILFAMMLMLNALWKLEKNNFYFIIHKHIIFFAEGHEIVFFSISLSCICVWLPK